MLKRAHDRAGRVFRCSLGDDLDTRKDPVTVAVRSVQYKDWTQLRTLGRRSLKVRNAIEQLAKEIRNRLRTTLAKSSKQPVVVSDASREYRAQVAGMMPQQTTGLTSWSRRGRR